MKISSWITKKMEDKKIKNIMKKVEAIETYEKFAGAGVFRVVFCLFKKPMRYSELEFFTKLPRATLQKVLTLLKEADLIETFAQYDDSRRKEVVTFYKLKNVVLSNLGYRLDHPDLPSDMKKLRENLKKVK